MSNVDEDLEDLKPAQTPGYKPGAKKDIKTYAELDAEDESLNRWKASLGIVPGAAAPAPTSGPKLTVLTLELAAPSLPPGKEIRFDLTTDDLAELKKNPIHIKEDSEYNVRITFKVNHSIVSGVQYIQVVKRAGIKVDTLQKMLGSYGPATDGKPYVQNFEPDHSPSGMVARSGTYNVRSRVIDDDGEIFRDWEWSFKLTKEW